MSQTPTQFLRCFTLGRYTATIEDGELRIRGPQPLAGPLPSSIKANRDEVVEFLDEGGRGTWPSAPGSGVREVEEFLGCGPAVALDVVEAAQRRAA